MAETDDLDPDQKKVIGLPLKGSHLITGPPGSGKTNLLLLRANFMYLAGQKNIAALVFTRTLQEFIASGGAGYDFPVSKVTTLRNWQSRLLHQYGVPVQFPSDDFDEQRQYLVNAVSDLIAKKKLSDIYEAILIDEAHDYLPDEISVFKRLAKTIFATADSRQKIYQGQECLDSLRAAVDQEHILRYHYRIGTQVCKLADAIAKDTADYQPLLPTCNYNEASKPSSIEHYRFASLADQAQRIIEKLKIQIQAYPDELHGVLCPKNDEVREIWDVIKASELGDNAVVQFADSHSAFLPDTKVCVATVHAAKGLEFRAVHIAAGESFKKFPLNRNMAFTAVTRAKTSLSIYYSRDLPGFIEQALNTLEPPPQIPKIQDAFGKKAKKHVD